MAKKKSGSFFIKYMEFVLTRNHFICNYVAAITIGTIKLVFKPVFLKQFQFFKPFDTL